MKMHRGGFLREDALRDLGIADVGVNVAVHESCVLVALDRMRFGSNIRIDAFSVLSAAGGELVIGDFIHIACHVQISAGAGVILEPFCNIGAGSHLLSRSDDFSGAHLIGPTLPPGYTKVTGERPLRVGRHAVMGAGVIVLPNVCIGEGSAAGARSLVTRDLDPWGIYAGTPARYIRERKRDVLTMEQKLREDMGAGRVTLPVSRL